MGTSVGGQKLHLQHLFAPLVAGTIDGAITVTASGITAPQVLNPAGTATVTTGSSARYAYDVEYSNFTPGLIVAYEMNPTTGALRALETVQLPSDNFGIVVTHPRNFSTPLTVRKSSATASERWPADATHRIPFSLDAAARCASLRNGKFADQLGNEYSLNTTTGALTSVGTATTGGEPLDVAITPAGTFVYIPNFKDGTISGFLQLTRLPAS